MSKLLHAPPCFIHASVRAILTLFVSLCLRRRPLPLLQYQIKQQPKPTSALVCSKSQRVVFIQIILLLQKLTEPCSTQFEVWAKGFLHDYLKRQSKFILAVNIGFFSLVGAGFAENLSWSGTTIASDYRSPINFTGSNSNTGGCLFEVVFSPAGPAFIRSVFSGSNTGLGRYWYPPSGSTWSPRTEAQIRTKLLQCYPNEQINDIVNYAERDWTSQTFAGITFTRSGDSGFLYKFGFEGSGSGTIFTNTKTAIDTTAPTVALTTTASTFSGLFTVTATFSEAVTGFVVGDVTVVNGTASNFAATSTSIYTFDVTPTADGTVTVDVVGSVAIDAASNNNTAATQLSVTYDTSAPTVVLTGPSDTVTASFTVTATFSKAVTGLLQSEITVPASEGTVTGLSGSGAVYTITVDPILGQTVNVSIAANVAQDGAGNVNTASNTLSIQAGAPASAFEAGKSKIVSVVTSEAMRGLGSALSSNVRMASVARGRFIARQSRQTPKPVAQPTVKTPQNATAGIRVTPPLTKIEQAQVDLALGYMLALEQTTPAPDTSKRLASNQRIPFDIDGTADAANGTLSTKGTFSEQWGNEDGTVVSFFYGDFNAQRDDDGSVSASLNAKRVWERAASETMTVGYFVGAEAGRATLKGEFAGDQNGFGISAGGYFVSTIKQNLYIDGFASLGISRKYLDIKNVTLNLTSTYEPVTSTIGGSLTGVVPMGSYEIWPQVQLTHGRTNIGTMPITATAYGLTDSTLSMDGGSISQSSITLNSQIKVPLDAVDVSQSRSMFTFVPRVTCSRTEMASFTNDCGGGAEFGYSSTSEDGLRNTNAKVSMDRMGTTTTTGIELNMEIHF